MTERKIQKIKMGGEKVREAERGSLRGKKRAQSAFNFLTPVVSVCLSVTVSLQTTTLSTLCSGTHTHMHIEPYAHTTIHKHSHSVTSCKKPTCSFYRHTRMHTAIRHANKPEQNVWLQPCLSASASPTLSNRCLWKPHKHSLLGNIGSQERTYIGHTPPQFESRCMCECMHFVHMLLLYTVVLLHNTLHFLEQCSCKKKVKPVLILQNVARIVAR